MRLALVAIVLLAGCAVLTNARAADPPAATQALSPEEVDQKALDDLRQQMGNLPQTNPKEALNRYTEFFTNRPKLSTLVAVELSSAIAKLESEGLKDDTQAKGVYDWALKKYGDDPRAVPLVMAKAKLLESNGDELAACSVYHDWLPAILKGWPQNANEPLDDYSRLLLKQGQTHEAVHMLGQMLIMEPAYLDPGPPNWDWVYPRIINALTADGQPRGAMRWARLRFMESAYDVDRLRKASVLLAKAWTAADPDGAFRKAFVAAQENPALPNPLADFPLPTLDAASLASRLEGASGADLISLKLAAGQFKDAMEEAKKMADEEKTASQGILQICRIFKAADLNLSRAPLYLQFLKTRQGQDPVEEFLKNPPVNPTDNPVAAATTAGAGQ